MRDPPHLVTAEHPRFCVQVRYGEPAYAKYFRKIFENKTFRIYEVIKNP